MNRRTFTDRETQAVIDFLKLLHVAAPTETKVAMQKFAHVVQYLPSPKEPGRPTKWTIEWRAALVIFVERRVCREILQGSYRRYMNLTKRDIDHFRTLALKQSLDRRFPFRHRTLSAAKWQLNESKRELRKIDTPGKSLTWIVSAVMFEEVFRRFQSAGAESARKIMLSLCPEFEYMPAWVWDKMANEGRILMPDVPREK